QLVADLFRLVESGHGGEALDGVGQVPSRGAGVSVAATHRGGIAVERRREQVVARMARFLCLGFGSGGARRRARGLRGLRLCLGYRDWGRIASWPLRGGRGRLDGSSGRLGTRNSSDLRGR